MHELFAVSRLVFGPVGRVHDIDAWVQQRCSVVRVMCAQLPLDSQM